MAPLAAAGHVLGRSCFAVVLSVSLLLKSQGGPLALDPGAAAGAAGHAHCVGWQAVELGGKACCLLSLKHERQSAFSD